MDEKTLVENINLDEIVKLTSTMVKIPSHIDVKMKESGVCEFISDWFAKNNISYLIMETDGLKIPIAFIKGKTSSNAILLNGHMDTTNVKYMNDPYSGKIDDNYIHGRGTTDMKGALCSMMVAFKTFKDLINPSTDIYLFPTNGEETSNTTASNGFVNDLGIKYAVVGEPTNLNIATFNKGLYFFKIKSIGKSAHLSVPNEGINAIENLCTVITELNKTYFTQKFNNSSGNSLFVLCNMVGGSEGIPDYAEALYNRRTITGDSFEEDKENIIDVVSKLKNKIPSLNVNVEFASEFGNTLDPMETPSDKNFIDTIYNALNSSLESQLTIFPGWTEGSIFRKKGIDTIIFGPGYLKDAHTPDEKIEKTQLYLSCEGYVRILMAHHKRFEK